MSRVLTETIEHLRVLQNSAGALSQRQELVELPLNKAGRDVMGSESRPEFLPINHMIGRQSSTMIFPPKECCTAELLGGEDHLTFLSARNGEDSELGFDGTNPCIRLQRLIRLGEDRGMGSEEVLETSGLRKGLLLVASPTIPSQQLLLQLTLLLLHVAEQLGLHCKHLLKVLRHGWRGRESLFSGP